MPTLLDWLISEYPLAKRQTFKQMLTQGRLSINGRRPQSLRVAIEKSDRITVSDRAQSRSSAPNEKLPFEIVHEDADVLVIDKPHGVITSSTPREKRPTAWAAVQQYLGATDSAARPGSIRPNSSRPGLIHRLDRDASGLLVFSKNDIAYRHLKQQFLHHTVSRIYIAHIHGKLDPPAGRIESYLIEKADGMVQSTRLHAKGQHAITDYQTLSTTDATSILQLTLYTGRKHQLRAQLAEKGTPIVNDVLYCDRPPAGPLMLVAMELAFDHPRTGKRMKFQADRDRR
jgi:23S rRNA pseudouridine1911/1915/1917 synthase